MVKNYFKIAWRNLLRNKGFSLTNLLGLTIGITCTILIFLWVKDELGYDKFHKDHQNIYQVIAHRDFNNQVFTDRNMVLPLAKALRENSSLVKDAVVTTHQQSHILEFGETKIKQQGYTVSEHFFKMFSWQFVKGNAASAIPDAYSIVLTESAAKSLFGNADALNKSIRIDNEYNAKVTAIIKDPPGNSTFKFDFINTFNYDNEFLKRSMSEWTNSSWNVFVQVSPGTNMKVLEKQINDIKHQHDPADKKISTYFTFPMDKWRLYSEFRDGKNVGGMIEYVKLFTVIAIIILLIACVNFMNLSTARSEKRAKEVGIRKTLGSAKRQLVLQFFLESMILAFIAFLLSLGIIYLLLPSFNTLVDKQLVLEIDRFIFWIVAVAIILFTGVIAGSYPALYLSSFNPVTVLKGTFLPGKSAALPRHILVVGQFIISILLISATVIVYHQIQYVKDRNMGYNPENLVSIPSSPDTDKNFDVIRNELLKTGQISSVTRSSSPITAVWWRTGAPDWEGKPANSQFIVTAMATDKHFTKTMGIKMLQGSDFLGTPSDTSSMLLNKAAVDAMGLKNPIGMLMRLGKPYKVIGITENVVMESPYKAVDPMIMIYDGSSSNSISVRIAGKKMKETLIAIETIFKKYNPAYPFEYTFVDQEFGKKFLTEELISKITNIFAGLAIFICCIGIAGLASFTIEKRVREIGIRKVLGATVQQLLLLIAKQFLKLVLIAFIIAVPLTWWLMSNWLESYAYRVNISSWLFAAVGTVVLLLTLLVVCLNTIGAATANPVKSLRTE